MEEEKYEDKRIRKQTIAARVWSEKNLEIVDDFPFLTDLKERFPKQVKALLRLWANERILAERLEHKRQANPDYRNGSIYNRTYRRWEKIRSKSDRLLNELVLLAAHDTQPTETIMEGPDNDD